MAAQVQFQGNAAATPADGATFPVTQIRIPITRAPMTVAVVAPVQFQLQAGQSQQLVPAHLSACKWVLILTDAPVLVGITYASQADEDPPQVIPCSGCLYLESSGTAITGITVTGAARVEALLAGD